MADPLANLNNYVIGSKPADTSSQTDPLTNMDQYISPGPEPAANTSWVGAAKDIGVGAAKGAASVLDWLFGPTLQGINSMIPSSKPKDLSVSPYSKAADTFLPDYENPAIGRTAEGTAAGALTAGPVGAAVGAISSGGTELLNKVNPDHPIANTVLPMSAGIVAGGVLAKNAARLGKVASEGLRITDRPELVQAKRDLGITSGTAASTTDDPFWHKMQRGMRERVLIPGSSNVEHNIAAEQGQLGSAVERQANNLFPAQTKQEVGTGVQSSIEDGVDTVKRIFRTQEQALDRAVDPNTTLVDMRPFVSRAINDISSSPGAHIPIGGGNIQHGDKIVTDLMDNIIQYGNSTNGLSVQAIRELKQQVGDQLKASLLNGDSNKRQLGQIYGVLADAQGAAYAGTPYAAQYTALKAAEREMYTQIEAFAEPLIRKGITPERMADMVTNQMKMGGTKLSELINVMEQASPSIRNQLGSSILLNIGRDVRGQFSPDRFFTRWQQISPEAKQALFGRGPNQDIPQIYDQLALVAQNQARGAKAVNTSGTGGVNELWHELRTWGAIAGGIGGVGYGTFTASKQDQAGNDSDTLIKGATGVGAGMAVAHLLGGAVMGKMLTNPMFLRWLATPTVENIPAHAKGLAAIAAESPELEPALKSFKEYLESKQQKFAEGGVANENNPISGNVVSFGKQPRAGYFGASRNPVIPSSIGVQDIVNKLPQGGSPQSGFAARSGQGGAQWGTKMSDRDIQQWTKDKVANTTTIDQNPQKNKSILDSLIENSAFGAASPRGGFVGGVGKRGAQWDFQADTWEPPFNLNDAANNYAEGGSVNRAAQGASILEQALGLAPHQSAGAMKYMNINESKLDPSIVNPTSGAYGIAQWLGSRKRDLLSKYGNRPSFENQMEHMVSELRGPEGKTLAALRNAKTEKEAYDIWGRQFERPGEAALAKAGVNYKPGEVSIGSSNSNKISSEPKFSSPSYSSSDDSEDDDTTNQKALQLAEEHSQHAAAAGADPLVQAIIKTIWSTANV